MKQLNNNFVTTIPLLFRQLTVKASLKALAGLNAVRRAGLKVVRGSTAAISFLFRCVGGTHLLVWIARHFLDTRQQETVSALAKRWLLGSVLALTLGAFVYETVYRGSDSGATAKSGEETVERGVVAYDGIGGPEFLSPSALEILPQLPGTEDTEPAGAIVSGNVLEAPAIAVTRLENRLRETIEEYTIQDGDTLGGLAEQFGISIETILWENKLTTRSMLRPGMVLRILPTSGLSHVVSRGETLASIAKRYKVEDRAILGFNELPDASTIAIGLKLIIPEGTPPSLPRPVVPRQVGPSTPPPPALVRGEGMLMPTRYRRISQWFTWRHSGIDMAGETGTPIWAAADGVVVQSGWGTGYGLYVLIDHGNGLMTRYAHNSKLYAQKGERVTKGSTIALMGSTGRSTGPHLHFETIVNRRFVDPRNYVKF